MTTKSNKPHTFAEMDERRALADVGDTLLVATSLLVKPTRYKVVDTDGDTLYIEGQRGTERTVICAAAEQTVWLSTANGNRRVVQMWVGRQPQTEAMFNMLDKAEAAAEIERLRAALYDTNAELVAIRSGENSEIKRLQTVLDRLNARLADEQRDAAEHKNVKADRDACRLALAQLYNVAHNDHPGSAPLPYEVTPAAVVIDVMAAMLWHSRPPESKPIRVPDTYRSAIKIALPKHMQNEKAGART
jgi:hypothetical protein